MSLPFYEGPKQPIPVYVVQGYLDTLIAIRSAGLPLTVTARTGLGIITSQELGIVTQPGDTDKVNPENGHPPRV